jgi:two-component system CheB/CheR fusion protein
MWGLPPDMPVDFQLFYAGVHPDDRARVESAIRACADPAGDGIYDLEYRVIGIGDGVERWVATRGQTTFDGAVPVGFLGVALDITARKRAEQLNLLLIAELQHRTRNLLQLVSSLSEQTLASCRSIDEFSIAFVRRLAALSRAQGLLFRHDSAPATIGELVRLELGALGAEPDGLRIVVHGPEVALPHKSVQILALALHELATNARKHGALGRPEGSLTVTWQLSGEEDDRRLALEWHESGYRPHLDEAPTHIGFGRTLIEESLPFQLDAQTRLEFGPNEVRCSLSLPLARR